MTENLQKGNKISKRFKGVKTWAFVLLLVCYIFAFGSIVFFAVGDRWPADWNFGAVPDVPGQSPYSTERIE